MARKATALAAARRHLWNAFETACRRRSRRLPTVQTLAAQAGVSHPVMLKAVAELQRQGRIDSRPGRGILAMEPSATPPSPAPARRPEPKWRTLLVQLEKDIQDGVHVFGVPLPPLKELAADYGVGYRTLKRALEALVHHGSIVPYKRGYRVRDIEAGRFRSSVVLITRGDRAGNLSESSPRMHDHVRAVERECSRNNLRLQVFTYDFEEVYLYPMERWRDIVQDEGARSSVIGFVVWPITMSDNILQELLHRLGKLGRPVSVLDEAGEIAPGLIGPSSSPTRLFAIASTPAPARALGRYLISLGHRRIAFISPFPATVWSRNRIRGLRQAYAAAGLPAVRRFETELNDVVEPPETHAAIHQTIEELVEGLAARAGSHARLARALQALRWRIAAAMQHQVEHQELVRLFRRVRAEAPEATAWVGANDYVAVEALQFLRAEGCRVPDDMTVVGMDDGLEAYRYNLTSHNFSGEEVIRAMIGHILDPDRRSTDSARTPPDEIEGFVVVRGTSGRPRTQNDNGRGTRR